jgi:hypothetical protein
VVLLTAPNAGLATPVLSQIRHYRKPVALPPLTPELREVIVGTALGDLYIGNSTGSHNAHLKFGQGIDNAPYLMHLYSLFESYCGSNSPPSGVDPPHPRFLDLTCSVQKRK